MPKISSNLRKGFNVPLPGPATSSTPKNEEILSILKELKTRLEKLEQNQTSILYNQSFLSNGQVAIVNNQQQIASKIEKIEAHIVTKAEMMAQSKLLMGCRVAIKKVGELSVCRKTGETSDKKNHEIANILPLQKLPAVQNLEKKLEDSPDFAKAMTSYLYKLKGTSEDVSTVIRSIFTDELLEKYNWDGRRKKQALAKLILFDKTLRDVFREQDALGFEKSVKKALERSHHRLKQKKYLNKEK